MNNIKDIIAESIGVKERILNDKEIISLISDISNLIVKSYSQNNKVLFCGNGGSAADAQHLSAELSGRFYKDRNPLDSEALHVNTSYLTAVANDYSFDLVFSRLVQAKGKKSDVLIALSTSGNSPNIVKAVEEAKNIGMVTVGLTGAEGGKLKDICDYILMVPSSDTPRIQEAHIMIGHIVCEIVEGALFT
jgi:D-sedoheptulose 7-phosphate isomerase